jgi:hypothetical protein
MANSEFSTITEIVPQISYDLIGRIVPGITVLVSLIAVVMGPRETLHWMDEIILRPNPPLSGWAIVLAIIAAYVLAMLLDGLWQIPVCIRRLRGLPCEPDLTHPSTSLKFDLINQRLPNRILDDKALCRDQSGSGAHLGWTLCAAINGWNMIRSYSLDKLWLECISSWELRGAGGQQQHHNHTRGQLKEPVGDLKSAEYLTERR